MMKKMLSLMLFLMFLGAASVNSQVRIGGNDKPHDAAVLDLNVDNDTTPTVNKGALALPRVSLTDTTAELNGTVPLDGMLIYNTGGKLSAGLYYWKDGKWQDLSGNYVLGGDSLVDINNAQLGDVLTKNEQGWSAMPGWELINWDFQIVLNTGAGATGSYAITYPPRCTFKNTWINATSDFPQAVAYNHKSTGHLVYLRTTYTGASTVTFFALCLRATR